METVFITIHDLSLDARIRYCSDSVEDILGYLPQEIRGKSCWDFFHPDEIPFAKSVHGQGVHLDKAAVFNYCRIRHKNGDWVGCECVFTVVYDVLVASTAIYHRGPKSRKRANDGANIRRIFSSAPRDPRYHMLAHISDKFFQEPQPHAREPRAAFFLNRFTKSSTIMFATNGVSDILGLEPSQLIGKSFYFCIAQNCLDDAIRCLESAKSNDSIAYLRFWYRDPTQDNLRPRNNSVTSSISEDEDDDGGVLITSGRHSSSGMRTNSPTFDSTKTASFAQRFAERPDNEQVVTPDSTQHLQPPSQTRSSEGQSRSSSDEGMMANGTSQDAVFDPPPLLPRQSSASSVTPNEDTVVPLELEAVVSCTSDGLVVVLRRARPLVPHTADVSDTPYYANGLFASPWASQPVLPNDLQQATSVPGLVFPPAREPVESGYMAAIRDVAVFAWSLTGINGRLVDHARGNPTGESLPAGGLPVWDPNAVIDAATNDRRNGFSDSTHRRIETVDLDMRRSSEAAVDGLERDSSDDEVLWKRVPTQPPWKRPKRRAHQDAFGSDGETDSERRQARDERNSKSRMRKIGEAK